MDKLTVEKIEELVVTKNLSIDAACRTLEIDKSDFYKYLKTLDDKQFTHLFARAREVRGLKLLDDCAEAFDQMKEITDDEGSGKKLWRLKNTIDSGMRLAAMYNKNLGDKGLSIQNNTQINNYGHDEFVLKKLEAK